MKKIFVLLLLVMATIGLASCDSTKSNTAQGSGEESGNLKLNVAVLYYNYADNYISTVRSALDSKFDANPDISYTDYDGVNNQATQVDTFKNCLSKGFNMIIVNIVDTNSSNAAQNMVNDCKTRNLPIVFFNREVSDEVVNSYEQCAFVGTNAIEAGYMQGDMIGDYLLENYEKYDLNGDGIIQYVMFKGQEGNKEADYRTQYGVENADTKLVAAGKHKLQYYGGDDARTKYLLDDQGAWSAQQAQDKLSVVLGDHNEANNNMIELVICNNDNMAEGAISALQGKGYNKEDSKTTIPVFGVDATAAAQSLITKGFMAGTVKQDNVAMAKGIYDLVANIDTKAALMSNIDKDHNYNVDETVDKIRIPYSLFQK